MAALHRAERRLLPQRGCLRWARHLGSAHRPARGECWLGAGARPRTGYFAGSTLTSCPSCRSPAGSDERPTRSSLADGAWGYPHLVPGSGHARTRRCSGAGTVAGLSAGVLAERLGRSTEQVRARRRKLLGSAPAGRPYLPHENEAIGLCLSVGGDLIGLAHGLGRSPDALRLHAQHIGLHHPRLRRRFSGWEDDVIRHG